MTCARLEVLVLAVILLAGCTSIETHRPRALKGLEKTAALDEAAVQYEKTEKRYESPNQFHLAVIKPDYFKLEYPGYLVGIEKVNFRRVGVPAYGNCAVGAAYCLNTGSAYFADKPDVRSEIEVRLEGPWWAKNLGFAKTQIVSHIVRFENKPDGATSRWRGCLIYNTYGPINGAECDPGDKLPIETPVHKNVPRTDYTVGWDAIMAMKADLASKFADPEPPTHLFLFSTGWNTPQWESLANYNDLYRNLLAAANDDGDARFRPVFVGLSWPSFWDNPTGTYGGDFVNKANDADEIGIVWANLIIQKVLLPLKEQWSRDGATVRVVLVGHSFGARIVSRAAFSAPLLAESGPQVDLLIGLQGAFSANRFVKGGGIAPAPFQDFRNGFVRNAVFTTSDNDEAVKLLARAGIPYIGAGKTFGDVADEKHRNYKKYGKVFSRMWLDKYGDFARDDNWMDTLCAREKVKLVKADEVVKTHIPGTGGGAHSDIYDAEIGRFMWNVIKAIPECEKRWGS